jgi:hypothetical protein
MMDMNRHAGRKFCADLACPDALDEGYLVYENGTPILGFPLLTFEVMVDHPDRIYLPLKRGGTSLQVTQPNYGLSPA